MKYTVLFSCGHEEVVDLIGENSEREKKLIGYERYGLCKECYKKKMREQEAQEPLQFNVTVLPNINSQNGSIRLSVWFSGNTMPFKDEIKALGGYMWSESKEAKYELSFNRPPLCWNKEIDFEELHAEMEKAEAIGAKSIASESGLFALANYQIALKKQEKWKETREKVSEIDKPVVPLILKEHKWNQKIYGRNGAYSVYLDGEKVLIDDEQAEEIKVYLDAMKEYNKKVKEIQK